MEFGGRRGYYGRNKFVSKDGWNTILNKKQAKQEKIFFNREARLRNATSFFISNLPDSCNRAMLWKAFEHTEILEDAFVPAKKDRAGNRFGFIKLSNINEPAGWIEKLKEVRIEGAVIDVCLAKFDRFGSKIVHNKAGERVSVFERLTRMDPVIEPLKVPGNSTSHYPGLRSYKSVLAPNSKVKTDNLIELPPMNVETKKIWEYKALVGEAKDLDILNNLKRHLSGIMEDGLGLKYLGGLKVLLCFDSAVQAEEFHVNMIEEWEKWFTRVYVWEGVPPVFERVAWIKILGVPISLWDRHVFDRIGERCGRILVNSEAAVSDGNMSKERLAILTSSGKKISEEFQLSWKNHVMKVWVEEILGQWHLNFLEPSDSDGSPEVSSVFGDSPASGYGQSKGCMENGSVYCMGNSTDVVCIIPIPICKISACLGMRSRHHAVMMK
ncbi:putative nucleotide-binding alpha-beta plait domain superfamily, RNA-binding domain superfamily [Helianthus annuus]|nr:putative nucleotide-binding alpha-beta plait domain superfamily, RNA-binding domain superfamily [Helianthus annuus]